MPRPTATKARIDPALFARRLRQWSEITDLCLALRGARLLGSAARDVKECVAAGLREANRIRERETGG